MQWETVHGHEYVVLDDVHWSDEGKYSRYLLKAIMSGKDTFQQRSAHALNRTILRSKGAQRAAAEARGELLENDVLILG